MRRTLVVLVSDGGYGEWKKKKKKAVTFPHWPWSLTRKKRGLFRFGAIITRSRAFPNVDKSVPPSVSSSLHLILILLPSPPRRPPKMMATGYSTLFSLGLSSIHTSFTRDPDARTSSSSLSLSATPSTPSSSAAVAPPKIQIDTQTLRPQHRRRRSSITAANSPLGNIGVKSPAQAARTSAASPARQRHRRSESDAVQRLRSYSMGDGIRSRRGPTRTPPPDMPLPAVPAIPAEYISASKKRTSSPVRPPSEPAGYRRTCLSDKDWALNSGLGSRSSFAVPSSAASWRSSQMLLTPSFATKLAFAMNTPPGSDFPSPNPMQSPVDPVLGTSYFEARLIADHDVKEN
ncbi:hypothetical protein ACEPAH_3838 [Sanghuangporus vaninii]